VQQKTQLTVTPASGEIATRVLNACAEHPTPIATLALSSASDTSHTRHATATHTLDSAAAYLDVAQLIAVARAHNIDAVHPGYGFLSESAEFAARMWAEAGAVVVGPGAAVLRATGDKLSAREVAGRCAVGVLPAMGRATGDAAEVRGWMRAAGVTWPVLLKAVDGGGGRGIRLVREEGELDGAMRRAVEESPSRRVFAEKAALGGFRHVEVQIVGDGDGGVRHLWERDCSVQRRYQKVVEVAPSSLGDEVFVEGIRQAAVRMARALEYLSLGTFEFLANPRTREVYFLEVNPRLQVEHTITEQLCGVDLVRAQLDIAQGAALDEAIPHDLPAPRAHSIQLRVTAENVHADWTLSVGKITSFSFPTGHGVRVDTHLVSGHPAIVTADFDSLLAKIIVTASSHEAAVAKARRALADTRIEGVATNLDILRGIVASADFLAGRCDTEWLEANFKTLLAEGVKLRPPANDPFFAQAHTQGSSVLSASSTSSVLVRKGDAWSVALSPVSGGAASPAPASHHLKLLKVHRNELPAALTADILYTTPASPSPEPMRLVLTSTTASSSSLLSASKHRRGDTANAAHVVIPFAGRLVEVLIDEGDNVQAGDVICVVRQMKMELEVRCQRAGRVTWVMEVDEGEDVSEGMLACEVEDIQDARPKL